MNVESKVIGNFDNRDVIRYELINDHGFQVNVLNYGGIITDILAPDKNGVLENVVLKYKDLAAYKRNPSYLGATIGRTSGRVCEGMISLDDATIVLNKNYGLHQGHGGNEGFNKKFWESKAFVADDIVTLKLSYLSVDGEENYPGNLKVDVEYMVTNDNELIMRYTAISDKNTLVNLTNHSYFNLSGDVKESILNHSLYIDSDYLVELDSTQIPTGKLLDVKNTPFDFKSAKKIGKDIDGVHEQLKIGNGYDHPWLLNKGNDCKVKVYHKTSGRALDIYTNQDSVVVYSMNFPDEELLFIERKAEKREGICFETQSPPIGRNNSFIKNSILKAGEEYSKETVYKFYVK